jgi:CubicO group peptidase (beta-lactamase class C family)
MTLQEINSLIERETPTLAKGPVAGYVGGIYHAGQQVSHAFGTANLNTGAAMTTDTKWLLGSITKVLTASLVMRLVEQGRVDLDRPVVHYLPEFRLKEEGAAERILVRQLLDHTNGIDADTLMPVREFGPRAVESYVEHLVHCGTLFPPGTFTHYSNPGFSLAARIIERLEGMTFNEALEHNLFAPLGMTHSCTSAEKAILGRTAIGAFPGSEAGTLRPTQMFMLPVSGAGPGATAIVTVDDLITFSRMHLSGGKSHDGTRYLSEESTSRMRAVSYDLGTPNCAPTGLGWRIVPIAGTTALWHGGGSPGGASSLAVFPEHDLVMVGFATGPGAWALHDAVIKTVLKELLGLSVTAPYETGAPPTDMAAFEGTFRHFQMAMSVRAVGRQLHCQSTFEPFDDDHRKFLIGYTGTTEMPPFVLEPINQTLFAPAGAPIEAFHGILQRLLLHSFHRPGPDGRFGFHHSHWRAARRSDP